MAESDVKILGRWSSPFVIRAGIALNMKSVKYQLLEEKFGEKSDLLLAANPVYKKVPVLIHGDNVVCESMIIVQYIDDVWSSAGPSLLPSDPYDRAVARFWVSYIDDKWYLALSGIPKARGQEAKKAELVKVTEGLVLLEDAYEKCSKGKDFFGGDHVGYVDIALGSYLAWLKVTEITTGAKLLDATKIPGLVKWAEKFCAEQSVKDIMPGTDELLGFAKILFAKLASSPVIAISR